MLDLKTKNALDGMKKCVEFMMAHKESLEDRRLNVYSIARTMSPLPKTLRKNDFVQAILNSELSAAEITKNLWVVHEIREYGKQLSTNGDLCDFLGLKTPNQEKQEAKKEAQKAKENEALHEEIRNVVREYMADAFRVLLNILDNNDNNNK